MPSGPFVQLAWVVADIEGAEDLFKRNHGVEHWTRLPAIHFGPETCTYRGRPADFVSHIALSYVGDLQLELIEPVSGASIYSEFLNAHGPGLHHGCWEAADLDSMVAGVDVIQSGSMADDALRFAYLASGLPGIPFCELVEVHPAMQAFFDRIKEECNG